MTDSHFSSFTKDNKQWVTPITNTKKSKTAKRYRRLKRFDVAEIGGLEQITAKLNDDETYYLLSTAVMDDDIETAHIASGERDRLRQETVKKCVLISLLL